MTKPQIRARLSDLSAEVATIVEKYQSLYDDMQSYFDDRSENWQMSDKGDEYQSMMDDVQSRIDGLENVAAFEIG